MIIGWRSIPYAARALARKCWRIITRQPLFTDEAEQEARRAVCRSCERHSGGQCEICTCFVELKTMWVDEFCPADPPKWK